MTLQSAGASRQRPPVLAITMGEPAGIGGELTLKAWSERHADGDTFFTIDNTERLRDLARALGQNIPVQTIGDPVEATGVFAHALPVLDIALGTAPRPGAPDPANAAAVTAAIETATALAMAGKIGGIVTNPIQKSSLYDAGFSYPGHTEFLAALSDAPNPPVMMLACPRISPTLRVVPVTIHVGLRRALDMLNTDLIVEQGRLTATALRHDFGISAPRIAVAGLNPHAGEQGAMGDEEAEIITPAIETLRADGLDVTGPEPPDTLFAESRRHGYDVALCMYHDQALIPVKTLDFSGGVNVTLGLPIVRTSPDHGTALNIAGQGNADVTSLLAAIDMAAEIAQLRTVRP